MDDRESEEFHKNLVADFLRDTYYKNRHFINSKGRNDQVIHNGPHASSSVGVIIEAKMASNWSDIADCVGYSGADRSTLLKDWTS